MLAVGNIAGPLLAYEVLTAFFLEASFLGVMLYGGERVSPRPHTLATFLVAAGTTLSAFWILALFPLPLRPHDARRGADGRLPDRRPFRLALAARPPEGRRRPPPAGCSAPGRAAHSLADPGRRPPRTQQPPAPAGQGRRHRGPLGNAAGGAPAAFRRPRRGAPRESLRRGDTRGRVPDPRPFVGRGNTRPRPVPRSSSAGGAGILGLPPHGRGWRADAGSLLVCRLAPAPRP